MLNLKLDEILTGELKAIYNVARKTAEQRAKAEAEEDKAMTQELLAILDEIEAVQAVHEEVDFIEELNDFMIQEEQPKVEPFDLMVNEYKAQNKQDATNHMGLIQNKAKGFNTTKQNCTIEELVDFINNGHSIYCSVLDLVKGSSVKDEQFSYQQVFGVDIDHTTMNLNQLLKALPYEPTIIYNTFSHTEQEPRYRVLFISNNKVTDAAKAKQIRQHLINSIPGADESCINASRIFFAGSVIYTNKYAIFDPFNIAVSDFEEEGSDYTPSHLISDTEPIIDVLKANLMSQEIQQLYGNRIVKTSYEAENHLKRIPLHMVLGLDVKVGQKCNCVLEDHIDNNGSAHIQITQKDNYYFYKCFGCDKTLYITDFITKDELLEILNIRTLWYENNRILIDYNRNLINDAETLKDDYPASYKKVKAYYKLLNVILDLAEEQLERLGRAFTTDKVDNIIISERYSTIGQRMSEKYSTPEKPFKGDRKNVQSQLDILMLMTFVIKLTDDNLKQINPKMLARNKSNIKSIDPKFNTQYAIMITKWNMRALTESEVNLDTFKRTGATTLGASQRQYKELGCDTRSKNNKSENTSALLNIQHCLVEYYQQCISNNGYVMKEDFLAFAKEHNIGRRMASTFIVKLNNYYGLERVIVNKVLTTKYETLTESDFRKCIFIGADNQK